MPRYGWSPKMIEYIIKIGCKKYDTYNDKIEKNIIKLGGLAMELYL